MWTFRAGFIGLCIAGMIALTPWARAAVLLHEKGELGPDSQTQTKQFAVDVGDPNAQIGIAVSAEIKAGKGAVRVTGPAGDVLLDESSGKAVVQTGKVLGPFSQSGTLRIDLSLENAVGKWKVVAVDMPERSALYPSLATGPLMMLVALLFAAGWFVRTRAKMRWFWAGAGIWTVGVALKVIVAIAANNGVLGLLKNALPHVAYVAAGAVYIGLLTGVFEIGVTLVFALLWRRMADDGNRAVAVGVGAGAFEALLLGAGGLAGAVMMFTSLPALDPQRVAVAYMGAMTPVLWLAGPAERVIAILCHISSRTLVLFGVATRRWSFFWYGFLVLTAVDTIAGVLHVGDLLGRFSMWWVEFSLLPFALLSIPITRWCLSHWPPPPCPETPVEGPGATPPTEA